MSGHLHLGSHPDPDSLNAFLEGALSEHEHLECLAHFAECSRCREIVFLAQEPQPAMLAPDLTPWWQRWFAPIPVLSGVAAAGVLTVGVWSYLSRAPVASIREVAINARPAPAITSPPTAHSMTTPPAQSLVTRKSARPTQHPAKGDNSSSGTQVASVPTPPPPPLLARDANRTPAAGDMTSAAVLRSSVGDLPKLSIRHDRSLAGDLSEITGTVTDPTGAFIPRANVTLRQLADRSTSNTQTDERGQFKVAALPPGRYELQIVAPGFQQTSGQIELQAQDLATVASVLSVGSLAETVEVTAAAPSPPMFSTISPPRSGDLALANNRPVPSSVARGKLMLRVDPGGVLFFSKDAGKHWKAVMPLWRGKVVQLATGAASPTSPEAFQITTDSGAVWLSRDGSHWYQNPPQR